MGVKLVLLILGCLAYCSKCTLAGYCTQSYTCTKQCSTQHVGKTQCGLFGWGLVSSWGKCTTYSTVYRLCPDTCYKYECCHGYTGNTCSEPLCHGSKYCNNGGRCVSPDTCSCRQGFSQPMCDDTNECAHGNGGCQEKCVNTHGSYYCQCSSGYKLGIDQKSCHDVDECEDKNGGCEDICTNTNGSYVCSCGGGNTLHDNGISCIEANKDIAKGPSILNRVLLVITFVIVIIAIVVGAVYLWCIKRQESSDRREKILDSYENDEIGSEENDGLIVWDIRVGTKKYGSPYEKQ